MAVGIYVALSGMTVDKYKESSQLLKQAGAAHPPGRTFHVAFGPSDKLMVFDVWSSQAAFDKFGKTLLPILQQLGIDPGQAPEKEKASLGQAREAGREEEVTRLTRR
jgi:hypothetical protein